MFSQTQYIFKICQNLKNNHCKPPLKIITVHEAKQNQKPNTKLPKKHTKQTIYRLHRISHLICTKHQHHEQTKTPIQEIPAKPKRNITWAKKQTPKKPNACLRNATDQEQHFIVNANSTNDFKKTIHIYLPTTEKRNTNTLNTSTLQNNKYMPQANKLKSYIF